MHAQSAASSPVSKKPSLSITAAVAEGLFWYPLITCGPLTIILPVRPDTTCHHHATTSAAQNGLVAGTIHIWYYQVSEAQTIFGATFDVLENKRPTVAWHTTTSIIYCFRPCSVMTPQITAHVPHTKTNDLCTIISSCPTCPLLTSA